MAERVEQSNETEKVALKVSDITQHAKGTVPGVLGNELLALRLLKRNHIISMRDAFCIDSASERRAYLVLELHPLRR